MIAASADKTRLCPHCANTIPEDAGECFYCKSEISSDFTPAWLQRDDNSARPAMTSHRRRLPSISPKVIWPAAMLGIAVVAFFAGGYFQRPDRTAADANAKQLQAKDLMLQSQESQLAQARQKLTETSDQLAEMKAKLDASQKDLALAEQRLGAARRAATSVLNRAPAPQPVASRAPAPSAPQPVSTRSSASTGVYVTTRPTAVHEDPSPSSRVISQIEGGTRINVVGSSGGWLEVRSRRGNPPGFVRADDARPGGAN